MNFLYHISSLGTYARTFSLCKKYSKKFAVQPEVAIIGAAGGFGKWSPYAKLGMIRATGFEPNPDEHNTLKSRYPLSDILSCAVGGSDGTSDFFCASSSDCSSLLQPIDGVLDGYSVSKKFLVKNQVQVDCRRLDTLLDRRELTQPDFLQIDVQGAEHALLSSAEKVLKGAVALELEAHLFPLYHDSLNICDISKWLRKRNYVLVHVEQQGSFGGESVAFNAFYLKLIDPKDARGILLQKIFLSVSNLRLLVHGTRDGLYAFDKN